MWVPPHSETHVLHNIQGHSGKSEMVLSLDEWGATDLVQVGVCTERQALSEITVSFLFAQSANLMIFIEEL